MSKRVAIVQSNYIPWKGYFDLISSVDEFILYDDVQYTKNDWRNRNKIKTPNGLMWLTIPVKGKYGQKIRETRISYSGWNRSHWQSIVHNYSRAKYFHVYKELFENLYLGCRENLLSQINYRFLIAICEILSISTHISWSMDYKVVGGKTARLVDLCKQVGATEYLSGPAAKAYLDEKLFQDEGIKLRYIDYSGYPEYNQQFPPFEHQVSIIDLLFNEGINTAHYMKNF